MDDKKEKITSKRVNLKNKKAVTKALSKTTTTKQKKAPAKKIKKEPKKEIKKVETKKIEEPKKIEETKKKVVKEDKKKLVKEDKNKKKTTKKKVPKKEPEKTKLVLPKEWQGIGTGKTSKTEPKDEKISGKLRSSIFEEIDEQTYQDKKKQQKKSLKKTLIVLLILIVIGSLAAFIIIKYNKHILDGLRKYDVYSIGDKVKLEDDSIWYVVEDSKDRDSTVKLLSERTIDLDKNDKRDWQDKKKFHNEGLDIYDAKDENSIAYYLNNEYKTEEEEKVGKLEEVTLLTSKEYIKIRERMGFGYEWSEGNWLANYDLYTWWINSTQNGKVYAVTYKGTYKLIKPDAINYIRPVIVISKDSVTKVVEPKEDDNQIIKSIENILNSKKKD